MNKLLEFVPEDKEEVLGRIVSHVHRVLDAEFPNSQNPEAGKRLAKTEFRTEDTANNLNVLAQIEAEQYSSKSELKNDTNPPSNQPSSAQGGLHLSQMDEAAYNKSSLKFWIIFLTVVVVLSVAVAAGVVTQLE